MAVFTRFEAASRGDRLPREAIAVVYLLLTEFDSVTSFTVRREFAEELGELLDKAVVHRHNVYVSFGPELPVPKAVQEARARRRETRGG